MATEYPRGSVGHVLHYLREWGIPETIAGSVRLLLGRVVDGPHQGKNCVFYGNELFAEYEYFDGIEQPLFFWRMHPLSYGAQRMVRQDDNSLKPEFRLSLDETTYMGGIRYPVLLFRGHDATPELRQFLYDTLGAYTATTKDVTRASSAFFKNCDDGNGFYVELNDPKGAQAFTDYINATYRPTV